MLEFFRHGYDILIYRMIARSCLNNEVFFFVYKRLVNLIQVATLNTYYVYVYWKCNDPFKCFDCYFVRIINIFLKVNVR